MAEKWTKTSSPLSRWINPKPFAALNHFTVPVSFKTTPSAICPAVSIDGGTAVGIKDSTGGPAVSKKRTRTITISVYQSLDRLARGSWLVGPPRRICQPPLTRGSARTRCRHVTISRLMLTLLEAGEPDYPRARGARSSPTRAAGNCVAGPRESQRLRRITFAPCWEVPRTLRRRGSTRSIRRRCRSPTREAFGAWKPAAVLLCESEVSRIVPARGGEDGAVARQREL